MKHNKQATKSGMTKSESQNVRTCNEIDAVFTCNDTTVVPIFLWTWFAF